MNLIELQPDDVLVLRCPMLLNAGQREAINSTLTLVFGEDQRIVVLDAGQAIDVIRVAVSGKVETNGIVRRANNSDTIVGDALAAGAAWREVQHVDTPDEEPAGIPPYVWLYRNMLTDLQALAPLGRDETNGQYAVAIDQLTEDQWYVPHILNQIALRADHYGVEARDLLLKDNTPT